MCVRKRDMGCVRAVTCRQRRMCRKYAASKLQIYVSVVVCQATISNESAVCQCGCWLCASMSTLDFPTLTSNSAGQVCRPVQVCMCVNMFVCEHASNFHPRISMYLFVYLSICLSIYESIPLYRCICMYIGFFWQCAQMAGVAHLVWATSGVSWGDGVRERQRKNERVKE